MLAGESQYGHADYLIDRQLEQMRIFCPAKVTMPNRWLDGFLGRAEELGVM